MPKLRRFKSNNVMLVIVAKKKELIIDFLKKLNFVDGFSIEETNGIAKSKIYTRKQNRNADLINSTDVGPDIWIYEFHDGKGYIHNNYIYKDLPRVSISVSVDTLFQTGQLSIFEAIKVIFRKQIFQLDDDRMYELLKIDNSNLFNSMVQKLVNIYINQDKPSIKYSFDSMDLIEYEAYNMLRDNRQNHAMFLKMQNLSYDQFKLINENNR